MEQFKQEELTPQPTEDTLESEALAAADTVEQPHGESPYDYLGVILKNMHGFGSALHEDGVYTEKAIDELVKNVIDVADLIDSKVGSEEQVRSDVISWLRENRHQTVLLDKGAGNSQQIETRAKEFRFQTRDRGEVTLTLQDLKKLSIEEIDKCLQALYTIAQNKAIMSSNDSRDRLVVKLGIKRPDEDTTKTRELEASARSLFSVHVDYQNLMKIVRAERDLRAQVKEWTETGQMQDRSVIDTQLEQYDREIYTISSKLLDELDHVDFSAVES